MKSFSSSRFKLAASVLAVQALLALFAYFLVLPVLGAEAGLSGTGLAALNLRYALVLLLAGILGAVATTLLCLAFSRNSHNCRFLIDALRQPCVALDAENCYVAVNRRAESLLGLDRERDLGKVVDSRVIPFLGRNIETDNAGIDLRSVANLNGTPYQVVDNPLDADAAKSGMARIVVLRNVDDQKRISDAIKEINQTMAVLNANTMKISSSAVSLSQGATEQASSLSSITSSMDEFSKKIQGSSETAAKGTQLAAQAREAAERSGGEIANALTAMTDVQDAGIRIARIVKLIDDIAFQTNLLALNAAVEAARAGRQGKGFAVVAGEVRNLAGRSARAAKDTASMVEDVTERIGNASAYISKLEEMLRNIVQDAIRMADSSATASTTSAQQAAGIHQVNRELGQMNSVTHSTMSAAEQTATAVEVLARQVDNLKRKLENLDALLHSNAGSATEEELKPLSINLYDDNEYPAPLERTHSYLDDNYPQYDADDQRADGGGREWNLEEERFDNDDSLANLLHSDGYDQDYQDFLHSGDDALGSGVGNRFTRQAEADDAGELTPDGDRVVKPNQNILLDDSEFGRY